jgi:hypothetical protein
MKKMMVLVAGGVGYVFGTKAGRERYEQLRQTFNKVKGNPKVQEKAQQAAHLAREKAPLVKNKISEAADTASTKVKSARGSSDAADQLNPESTAFQENSGPQGALP